MLGSKRSGCEAHAVEEDPAGSSGAPSPRTPEQLLVTRTATSPPTVPWAPTTPQRQDLPQHHSIDQSGQHEAAPSLFRRVVHGVRRVFGWLLGTGKLAEDGQEHTTVCGSEGSFYSASGADGQPLSPSRQGVRSGYPHPHQSMNERAMEAFRDARHVMADTQEALPEAVGRIMGKEHYAHPTQSSGKAPASQWHWYSPSRPSSPTPITHGGRELMDSIRQAGHTFRHPDSAAAEAAGRIMGRDNYVHPYHPQSRYPFPSMTTSGRVSHSGAAHLTKQVEDKPRPISAPPTRHGLDGNRWR